MQEAEREIKKMTDCQPAARRMREKKVDKMGKKHGAKYLLIFQ
jgi:hypothetical protein